MAPRLSPNPRTSAVTIPRQLAPTVGPAHGGFEFLNGNFEGLKGYVVGWMTKSRRGKLYIDDANWGPDAGSIEYGYRVPFGGIHVFIGKIGEPGLEPDLYADLIETAQRARPARALPALKHAFVGCVHGGLFDGSGSGDESAGTLRAAGRQPPYIKGRPGSGLGTRTISSRVGHSSLAPR